MSALKVSPDTVEAVRELFSQVLVIPPEEVREDSDFVYDLNGDSFSYAALIAEVEERFGVTIPPKKYARCTTVMDFARIVSGKDE